MIIGILLLLLALLGAPLFSIIGGGALWGFHSEEIDLQVVTIEIYRVAEMPILLAIPLFTFAGYLLGESQAPARMVRFAHALLGWMPGGLAIVALTACAMFTAFTGASGVTIVALGALLYPALQQAGYPERFNLGLITTSGSLGLLRPISDRLLLNMHRTIQNFTHNAGHFRLSQNIGPRQFIDGPAMTWLCQHRRCGGSDILQIDQA